MKTLHINAQDLEKLKASEKPVLLDFYADWCGPCKLLSPIVDRVAEQHEEILVAKINVDRESALAAEYGVVSIPTLIVLKNGQETARSLGAVSESRILSLIEE